MISAIFLMSGCASLGVCVGWEPIKPSHKDVLTDATAKQILKHDEYGKSLGCTGFRPKR